MNKKLLSLILAGATALSLSTAFAEDDYGTMLISEEVVETVQEEKHAAYITISGKITGVEEETFLAQTESGEEIIINKNALQLTITNEGEMIELQKDDSVTLYVREDTPMVLSLPAQYSPTVIVKATEAASTVMVDNFVKSGEDEFGMYINQGGNLAISVAEETEIIKLSREYFDGNLDGRDLIVIYDMVLYSLPAQTTPKKVIVLNMAQEVPAEAEGFSKIVAGEKEFDYVEAEGAEGMIPVRSVLEALGFTVEWNGELRSVMINSGKFTFAIGEDYYTIGRMAPVSLGQAPVCVCVDGTGITHVPMSFFTEIVGLSTEIADGVLTISAN